MPRNVIHTFGDSHADKHHSHWGNINNANIITHHLGGRLMYTFGKQGLKLCNIKNFGVNENDIVIFCFGEIDCRTHVFKHITNENSYQEIITEIVINYFKAIHENVKQYENLSVSVYNVIPPTRGFYCAPDHPYPFLGTNEERKTYYTFMNEQIKNLCKKHNYFYFDIYDACCDEEGFLKKEYSDGNVHLRNTEHSTKVVNDLINR